jgi:hypothetical protein
VSTEDLYVAGPYEGVSQAPPQVRLPGACEDMQDCIATIPNGIQKRPSFIANGTTPVATGGRGDEFALDIPRGSSALDATLLLVNKAGTITPVLFRTASLTPIAYTISGPAQAYLNLNNPSPNAGFRAVSIEDVVFITNRTVPIALGSATQATRPFEALLWVKVGEFARKYLVTVTSTAITGGGFIQCYYQPSTGGTASDGLGVGTDKIATGLYNGTIPSMSGAQSASNPAGAFLQGLTAYGFTVTLEGSSLIYLSHPTVDFTLTVSDDQGGTALEAIKGSVQDASDLPAVAIQGFVIEINPTGNDTDNGAYYLTYNATQSTTSGVWKETVQPGANLGYDPTTMPIQIAVTTNLSTGVETWVIQESPFVGRTTGNTLLSPDPDFVGETIQDVKWDKGRLALIHPSGVEYSASDSPYVFYSETLTSAPDSNPFGFLTPVDRKSFFKQGITFDQRFVCLSDKVQGIVSQQGVFTASNARMDTLATEDFYDPVVAQATKHRVYITAQNLDGNDNPIALAVSEIAIDRLSGLALIEEMSTAVPEYLPPTLDRSATYQKSYITVYGQSNTSAIYVHTYRYSEQQRVQNAFYRWNLPTGYTLCGWFVKVSTLYTYLLDAAGNIWSYRASLSPRAIPLEIFLDHKLVAGVGSYNALTNTTSYPVSGPTVTASWLAVDQVTGYQYTITAFTGATITLQGNTAADAIFFGTPYTSFFIPTRWYIVGQDGKPLRDGRLSVKALIVDVSDYTGYFRAEVSIKGRATRLTVYEGMFQDDTETQLDANTVSSARKLRVPIGGNAEDLSVKIVNDSYLGFKLVGYEWQGDFNPRHRRGT